MVGLGSVFVLRAVLAEQPIGLLLCSLGAILVIWVATKSLGLAFLLGSLLSLVLFDLPLSKYVDVLGKQIESDIILTILLWGIVLTFLSRGDIRARYEGLARRKTVSDDLRSDVARQAETFCLLEVLARYLRTLERRWCGAPRPGVFGRYVLSPLLMIPGWFASMVEPSLMIMLNKPLWAPGEGDMLATEAKKRLSLGMLCMCTSGALLFYFAPVQSAWWLFFRDLMDTRPASNLAFFPLGVGLYGLLSFYHGHAHLMRAVMEGEAVAEVVPVDTRARQARGFYLMVLAGFFALILGAGYLLAQNVGESYAHAATSVSGMVAHSGAEQAHESTEFWWNWLTGLLLSLILALILAQAVTSRFWFGDHTPMRHLWKEGAREIDTVAGMLASIVLVMAYTYLLQGQIEVAQGHHASLVTSAALGAFVALALTVATGLITGKPFGAFAIGFGILSLFEMPHPFWYGTVVEALILISAAASQFSPASLNAHALLDEENCGRQAMWALWCQPGWFGLPAVAVQGAIAAFALGLSAVLRAILLYAA